MARPLLVFFAAAVVLAVPLAGQTPAPASLSERGTRNAEPGARLPDLEGVWSFSTLTPVERPADVAGRPFFTDAEAAAFEKRALEGGDRDRRDGGAAVDVARAVNDYNHVIIFTEMIHDARIVPLDGRPHRSPVIQQWLGDSVGHYAGATLVVDTTNFTDKTHFRGTGAGLHLIERFTRGDANTLLYEFTVDDPATFTKPWTAVLPMTRTGDRIFEYACHEGNHALVDILRGARYQEKNGTPE